MCFAGRRAARDHILCGRQFGHLDVADDDADPAHAGETGAGPSVRRASGKRGWPWSRYPDYPTVVRTCMENRLRDDYAMIIFHLRNTHTYIADFVRSHSTRIVLCLSGSRGNNIRQDKSPLGTMVFMTYK